MVFSSLFGKRPTEPERPDTPEPEPEQKRGLFDRMRQAVTRTRESLTDSISSVIALTREVDQASLDELEPRLLAADIGSATTAIIMENLRQRALRTGIESGAQLKELLKIELKQVLDKVSHPIHGRSQRHRKDNHHRQAR
jgi:fused signal recognition particle receptor